MRCHHEGYGCPGMPFPMEGVIAMEMARIDAYSNLFVYNRVWQWVPYTARLLENKQKWFPQMQKFDKNGVLYFTELEVGSGV